MEHIINESRRCENELAAFTELIIHLYSAEETKEPIPVTELLDYFRDISNRCYLGDENQYQEITIAGYKNALDAVFSELARYIATTGIKQDETRSLSPRMIFPSAWVLKAGFSRDIKRIWTSGCHFLNTLSGKPAAMLSTVRENVSSGFPRINCKKFVRVFWVHGSAAVSRLNSRRES